MTPIAVSVREELQAALDLVDPLLEGRTIDVELARLQVLLDPTSFRAEVAALVESAVIVADRDRDRCHRRSWSVVTIPSP